jgi:hypothetical protein
MRCINATKRTRFSPSSSSFVTIVEEAAVAATAAIEEAYFWSTTHAEANPRCRFRWGERKRDRPSEEKTTTKKRRRNSSCRKVVIAKNEQAT